MSFLISDVSIVLELPIEAKTSSSFVLNASLSIIASVSFNSHSVIIFPTLSPISDISLPESSFQMVSSCFAERSISETMLSISLCLLTTG